MINSSKLKREAEKLKQEDKEFLLKFLKGGERLDNTNQSFKISQTIFNDFKDVVRNLHFLNEEQQYGQFKIVFNSIFYWSYSFQSDLDKFLTEFLRVFSDTNKEYFYKEFEIQTLTLLNKYEQDYEFERRTRQSISDLYRIYRIDFDKFVNDICLGKDNEFELEEDEKQYITSKKELVTELNTLFYMEYDLRKIYNNIKESLKKPKTKYNESKNS